MLILGACGPLGAHSAIARAHIALEAAEAAEAERFAVFEYRSAQLFLRKAKEEEGYSSFQEARDFAKMANQLADKARARALQNKKAKPRTLQEIQRERRAVQPAARPATGPQPGAPQAPQAAPQGLAPAPTMAPSPAPTYPTTPAN